MEDCISDTQNNIHCQFLRDSLNEYSTWGVPECDRPRLNMILSTPFISESVTMWANSNNTTIRSKPGNFEKGEYILMHPMLPDCWHTSMLHYFSWAIIIEFHNFRS